jgi:hypothetical protein
MAEVAVAKIPPAAKGVPTRRFSDTPPELAAAVSAAVAKAKALQANGSIGGGAGAGGVGSGGMGVGADGRARQPSAGVMPSSWSAADFTNSALAGSAPPPPPVPAPKALPKLPTDLSAAALAGSNSGSKRGSGRASLTASGRQVPDTRRSDLMPIEALEYHMRPDSARPDKVPVLTIPEPPPETLDPQVGIDAANADAKAAAAAGGDSEDGGGGGNVLQSPVMMGMTLVDLCDYKEKGFFNEQEFQLLKGQLMRAMAAGH